MTPAMAIQLWFQHVGGELSAHQMIVAEQERWTSIAQLGAEYETIGAVAQRDQWVRTIKNSGLSDAQVGQVLASESFGPLTAALRRAESDHHDVDKLLATLVRRRSLDDAEDVGAVLISRLQKAAQLKRGMHRLSPKLVVGLIPVVDGPMSEPMTKVLGELTELMEGRAMKLAEEAVECKLPWLKRLGAVPTTEVTRRRWLYEVGTVAAYRDRYGVDGRRTLGEPRTSRRSSMPPVLSRRSSVHGRSPRKPPTPRTGAAGLSDGRDGRWRSGTQRKFRPGYPQDGRWSARPVGTLA